MDRLPWGDGTSHQSTANAEYDSAGLGEPMETDTGAGNNCESTSEGKCSCG